jgi:hypothetical protein
MRVGRQPVSATTAITKAISRVSPIGYAMLVQMAAASPSPAAMIGGSTSAAENAASAREPSRPSSQRPLSKCPMRERTSSAMVTQLAG